MSVTRNGKLLYYDRIENGKFGTKILYLEKRLPSVKGKQYMKEKILEIIEEICPLEDIEEDTLLIEMGILDSLAIVSLIEKIEKELVIEIGDEDIILENFATVKAIDDLLRKYVK